MVESSAPEKLLEPEKKAQPKRVDKRHDRV